MIKASEGGGGKGIRKAENADDFPNLFRQVGKIRGKSLWFVSTIFSLRGDNKENVITISCDFPDQNVLLKEI
jgi:hypothetical protein